MLALCFGLCIGVALFNIWLLGESRIMPVTVDYYMTLTSPWTYLGSALFAEIARQNDATVNIKPCKFGPIFEQTGGLPLPKRSPQRRAYRMMELKRWREVRGIPVTIEPRHFPCDDTAARRTIGKREPSGFSSVPCNDDCAMEMVH
jgi:2-hydroxychromene-2-carboxylate isomerase